MTISNRAIETPADETAFLYTVESAQYITQYCGANVNPYDVAWSDMWDLQAVSMTCPKCGMQEGLIAIFEDEQVLVAETPDIED